MFTTPLRSENIPPIAPKMSGVANASICAIRAALKTASRFPMLGASCEDAEADAEQARRDRAVAEPRAAAGRPSRSRAAAATTPTRIGHVDRARLDRRDREERREDAEEDPGVPARRRVAQRRR